MKDVKKTLHEDHEGHEEHKERTNVFFGKSFLIDQKDLPKKLDLFFMIFTRFMFFM